MNTCTTELQHAGIKGMKWGVRRYQNKNGTLTPEGKKRYAKNQAYKEKLTNKASKKASNYRKAAKEAEYNVEDLKKRGANSDAYNKWKKDKDNSRMWEYEQKHSVTGPDGRKYVRKYDDSWDKFMNDLGDSQRSKYKVQELIDENNAAAKRSREKAKQWARTKKDLMNMEVSALTKKKDIRRVYWS